MAKRIVIAAGGTGGHLFPAQSLAGELVERSKGCQILFMAKGLSCNARFNRQAYPYVDIAASQMRIHWKTFWSIAKGIYQSIKALRRFRPDLVVGFGSYHSFPVLCAARLLRIPIILHEANSIPGKVNRIFSPYAVWTGVFFPNSAASLKGKVLQTDIPLRPQFSQKNRPSRDVGLQFYGLDPDILTVLVFGGSLGAARLNELAAQSLSLVSKKLQVLHFTGKLESSIKVRQEYNRAKVTAVVREFESEMQYAWAAADLCLCRAGASTIAESIAFTVPAIFIPYPEAADLHQDKNAQYIAQSVGGALYFQEHELEPFALAAAIDRLLLEHQLQKMGQALASFHASLQAHRFPDLVLEYLEGKR